MDIILGCPRLILQSPEIRWDTCEVTRWIKFCLQHCISALLKPFQTRRMAQIASTCIESLEPLEAPTVPSDYVAFQDVYSKQAATVLPPHWPWDCAIDLLPGNKINSPSVECIPCPSWSTRLLRTTSRRLFPNVSFIPPHYQPHTSPPFHPHLFVDKKDGVLRPCIDYRILNFQTVKQSLPTSPGPCHSRGTPWGTYLLQAGPTEHMQPR